MPAAQRQSCFLAISALPWRAVGTSSRADGRGNRVSVTLALDYRLMGWTLLRGARRPVERAPRARPDLA